VPAGTAMRLGNTNPPLIFTLNQDLVLLPVEKIALSVDGVDCTQDLAQWRPVHLLSNGKSSAEIALVFSLKERIPANISGFFTFVLELETPADVWAEWSPNAVSNVPAPATLIWSYRSASTGVPEIFAADQVHDGTAGLRRSGVVRLPLTGDWQPEPPGADASLVSYAVVLQIQNAAYTVVPRLVRVISNVGLAQHQWKRTKHPFTKNWLPLPGNVISLPDARDGSSWKEYPPVEDSVEVRVKERDGSTYSWKRVPDLALSGPSDRDFLVDRARAEIRFGDGLTGRLPVMLRQDDSEIEVGYQAGGGVAGNVGENLTWQSVPQKDSDPNPYFSAINVVPGDGGQESETLAAARQRAQAALNERNRAVTKKDYENVAQTTPGVAFRRAYAAVGYHPLFPCSTVPGAVTVFVVPYAPREDVDGDVAKEVFVPAPQPDPGALEAAKNRLNAARLVGSEVFVRRPVYRSVWLSANVVSDSALSVDLRQQIVTRLQKFLDPLVGGDEGKGWPFGDPLRPSSLVRVAQAALGGAADVLRVSVRLDGMDTPESCKDVAIGPHELLKLEQVVLHVQRRTASAGGLR
jgi:predicted phage baseplate assembly protein